MEDSCLEIDNFHALALKHGFLEELEEDRIEYLRKHLLKMSVCQRNKKSSIKK